MPDDRKIDTGEEETVPLATTANSGSTGVGRLQSALILAELGSALEAAMIYGSLIALIHHFGDPVLVGWMLTGYFLVQSAAAGLCGRLGDLFGRRTVLMAMLVLAGFGSLVCTLSDSNAGIILGRAIQGFSGAILPLCQGLVREHYPPSRVPSGIGLLIACAAVVGGGGGVFGGGLISEFLSWRYIFVVTAVMAAVAVVVVAAWVPRDTPRARSGSLDLLGGILFAPAIAGVLGAVTLARSAGWLALETAGLMAGSIVLLLFWIGWELRCRDPLIDVRMLATRNIGLANLTMFGIGVGTLSTTQVSMPLLQETAHAGGRLRLQHHRRGISVFLRSARGVRFGAAQRASVECGRDAQYADPVGRDAGGELGPDGAVSPTVMGVRRAAVAGAVQLHGGLRDRPGDRRAGRTGVACE